MTRRYFRNLHIRADKHHSVCTSQFVGKSYSFPTGDCAGGNRASGGAPGNGGPDAHDQQAKKRLMRRLVAVLTVIQNSQPGTAAAAEL